jgi:uncharacterized protein YbjT (DUF2867 family)
MADNKIIAVTGATGAQGGGLARAILASPDLGFSLRAITRNPDSEKAKALAAQGAEVVAADLDQPESLEKAFAGAYGAFCLTNYWEHMDAAKEEQQARNLANAAKSAGVEHAVWSTLEDTRKWVPLESDQMPTLYGHYKVPHFDTKGSSDQYFDPQATTFFLTSFYWDNFIHFGMAPQPGPDGVLGITFCMDDKPLPGIAAEDIGRCAFGVFQRPELRGQTVGVAGEHVTGQQMADGFSRVMGKEVRYNAVPPEVYRGFGFPGADDLGNMLQFKRDFNDYYCGARSIEFSRSLNPSLQSFNQWLDANASAFQG